MIAALIVAAMLAIVPADAQTAPEPPAAPGPDRYSDLVLADSPLAYHRFEATSGPEVFGAPGPEPGPEDAAERVVFAYDGNGLRREKVVDGQVTRFDWDLLAGLAQVAVESRPDEVRRFVHNGASPVQVGVDGEEFFTHQDSLGSTVAVSDRSGAVVARFDYDGYGNVAASQVTGAVPEGLERFADATLDAETGLWFLRARYYDSTLGVFTAVDPIDTATGDPYVSRYSYVAGRPTTMVDPSGLKLVDAGYGFVSGTVQGIRYAVNNPSAVLASIGRSLEDGISLHTALDVLGMVPVVGEVFDLVNGVYYWAEGNSVDAALSFAAVVPVVGSMAVGGRFVARNLDVVADSVGVTTRSMGRGVAALPMSVRRGYDQLAGFARTKVDNFRGALRHSDGVTDAAATRTPSGVPGGGDETVDLFRAVGVREFDAVQSSGKFLPSSREALDGRQFAATFDEALANADADLSKVAILKVTVDRSVLSGLDFSRTIDPLIFRSGVFTVQPGAQSNIFHAALRRIEQVL